MSGTGPQINLDMSALQTFVANAIKEDYKQANLLFKEDDIADDNQINAQHLDLILRHEIGGDARFNSDVGLAKVFDLARYPELLKEFFIEKAENFPLDKEQYSELYKVYEIISRKESLEKVNSKLLAKGNLALAEVKINELLEKKRQFHGFQVNGSPFDKQIAEIRKEIAQYKKQTGEFRLAERPALTNRIQGYAEEIHNLKEQIFAKVLELKPEFANYLKLQLSLFNMPEGGLSIGNPTNADLRFDQCKKLVIPILDNGHYTVAVVPLDGNGNSLYADASGQNKGSEYSFQINEFLQENGKELSNEFFSDEEKLQQDSHNCALFAYLNVKAMLTNDHAFLGSLKGIEKEAYDAKILEKRRELIKDYKSILAKIKVVSAQQAATVQPTESVQQHTQQGNLLKNKDSGFWGHFIPMASFAVCLPVMFVFAIVNPIAFLGILTIGLALYASYKFGFFDSFRTFEDSQKITIKHVAKVSDVSQKAGNIVENSPTLTTQFDAQRQSNSSSESSNSSEQIEAQAPSLKQ